MDHAPLPDAATMRQRNNCSAKLAATGAERTRQGRCLAGGASQKSARWVQLKTGHRRRRRRRWPDSVSATTQGPHALCSAHRRCGNKPPVWRPWQSQLAETHEITPRSAAPPSAHPLSACSLIRFAAQHSGLSFAPQVTRVRPLFRQVRPAGETTCVLCAGPAPSARQVGGLAAARRVLKCVCNRWTVGAALQARAHPGRSTRCRRGLQSPRPRPSAVCTAQAMRTGPFQALAAAENGARPHPPAGVISMRTAFFAACLLAVLGELRGSGIPGGASPRPCSGDGQPARRGGGARSAHSSASLADQRAHTVLSLCVPLTQAAPPRRPASFSPPRWRPPRRTTWWRLRRR